MRLKSGARGGLQDEPFSYHEAKDGQVFIRWRGADASALVGRPAFKFLQQVQGQSVQVQQLVMAKVTKNFKRSNA